ncbi:FmdB family zinc ribbon protein [Azohydromonas sediminis]|uniref:FmdB family zinc ribbon protein n=1 Tax=Azohydromonas sediminis TaxID=2259674 RepID=UPI000E659686|nr:zinc ribbon domain-containing protein [Azohydromonas sediminis]
MPTYDYACPACGGFDALRPYAQRDEPATCPDCGTPSPRVLAAMPRLACLPETMRRAMQINERAAHEPQSSAGYTRLAHPAGCGCCAPGRARATRRLPDGSKAIVGRRPWMISH